MDMAPEKYIQKLNCANGNKIIESCIPAEPLFPIDKKSIFYRAVEIGTNNGKEYIASDYRALVVMQKEYKD